MNDRILERFREYLSVSRFNAIKLGIASPQKILSLSYGEVKKIETINYRTLKAEKDGLFCAKIFGPQRDWECICGKYKRMKHRGVTCEKCGVEVIQARVRRERMGHIKLVAPVTHIWFLKGIPSYMSLILEMTVRDIEKVVYFDSYIVLRQGASPYPVKRVISTVEHEQYKTEHPEDIEFLAEMGAEAIEKVLAAVDLKFELDKSVVELTETNAIVSRQRVAKRCKILKGMLDAGIKPEWMVLSYCSVIPPELRPLVPLEGGRFASSDLNDLYRRVLNRNIRLKRLIELEAPNVIIKNEKRMLQESVDALIDNGRRGQPVRGSNKRPLKSLSELLRGKQGRFRQNLLGKRVDYSGRSVIVVEPELMLHQCGLPKIMALELFRPHLYAELQRREVVNNLRSAKKLVSKQTPEVWAALEHVVRGYPILLNRAPTLHRVSIQAFFPILIEGKAIKIHPMVCAAFNADFDGDQMAVHVPLSRNAKKEAERLMLSSRNVISPAHGRPLAVPTQDCVLGLYFLTKRRKGVTGEGMVFSSPEQAITAYNHGAVDMQACIRVRLASGSIVETTLGRTLLYSQFPKGVNFALFNKAMKRSDLANAVSKTYQEFGLDETVATLDKIKKLGFGMATNSGISLSMEDILIPEAKKEVLKKARAEAARTEELYQAGAITVGERHNTLIQIWAKATEDVAQAMFNEMETADLAAADNKDGSCPDFNPVFMMLDSGSKGSKQQIRQLGGMRGLMSNPAGELIETPVVANFKEGLSVFEYFISTHGARKGLADTALKTADAGYLTRRLVDVSQDVVISKIDCKTPGVVEIGDLEDGGNVIEPMYDRILGRVCARDVVDLLSKEVIVKSGTLITTPVLEKIKDSSVRKVPVRTPLVCTAKRGICASCYGMDMSSWKLVDVGQAVGIIAAQSIGEPGVQLTLRTFHVGGAASGLVEVTHRESRSAGLIRLEDVKTVRNADGHNVVVNRRSNLVIIADDGRELESYKIEYGSSLFVIDGQRVQKGHKLFSWHPFGVILTEHPGTIEYIDIVKNTSFVEEYDETTKSSVKVILERKDSKRQPCLAILDPSGVEVCRYYLPTGANLAVEQGSEVVAGQIISILPRQEQKAKDITGGLPRVVELFEARTPKDLALLAETDGEVSFGGISRGQRRINLTTPDGQTFEYNVPRSKRLNVEDGEEVSAGYQLTSGSPSVHDILRILGPDQAQAFLLREIQTIYISQGVGIHDKHIEVVIRQMLRRVRVVDAGDSTFVIGQKVDKIHLQAVNSALAAEGKRIVISKPLLMGITKASLETDSFIAAASFQETTRILAEAAICGDVDYLRCLKSNVAIGRLIPAGTGIPEFKKKHIGDDVSEIEQQASDEEALEISLDNVSLV